ICGVIGFKPTYGAVNKAGGFDPNPSLNHFGMLAGTLVDAWEITRYIARTVGGDPGHPGLYGDAALPAAKRPARLARQYTHGWSLTDAASKHAFETFLNTIQVIEPAASEDLTAHEAAKRRTPEFSFLLMLLAMAWRMPES